MITIRVISVLVSIWVLSGCMGQGSGYQDIDAFIAEAQSRPAGEIEPIPKMKSYDPFVYQAVSSRGPFDKPLNLFQTHGQTSSAVRPDLAREKQQLEAFDIAELSYVGSISNTRGVWGLVEVDKAIYKVRVGDYLGRNHGRITALNKQEIRLKETVLIGPNFWVDKPVIIPLRGN